MNKQTAPPLLMDAMLGELARWMRLQGYNAAFLPDTPDIVVMRKAKSEGRVIVTCDRKLARRRGIDAIWLESRKLEEQIETLIEDIGEPSEPLQIRCAICNTALVELHRLAAQKRVPPYVWRTHNTFSECPACNRVYWKGTHWEGITAQLNAG
jgi:uncharacterized protein with PIN domain